MCTYSGCIFICSSATSATSTVRRPWTLVFNDSLRFESALEKKTEQARAIEKKGEWQRAKMMFNVRYCASHDAAWMCQAICDGDNDGNRVFCVHSARPNSDLFAVYLRNVGRSKCTYNVCGRCSRDIRKRRCRIHKCLWTLSSAILPHLNTSWMWQQEATCLLCRHKFHTDKRINGHYYLKSSRHHSVMQTNILRIRRAINSSSATWLILHYPFICLLVPHGFWSLYGGRTRWCRSLHKIATKKKVMMKCRRTPANRKVIWRHGTNHFVHLHKRKNL